MYVHVLVNEIYKIEQHDEEWTKMKMICAFLIVTRKSCKSLVLLEIQYCDLNVENKSFRLMDTVIIFGNGDLYLKKCRTFDRYTSDINGTAMRAVLFLNLPIIIIYSFTREKRFALSLGLVHRKMVSAEL